MGQRRAVIDVPAVPHGPWMARRVVAAILVGWELAGLVEDAQLLVTELVTNAYRHAGGTDSFELELTYRAAGVRISLVDGSAIRPVVRELGQPGPNGRGMRLVEQLAARWGADDHQGGKRVWFDLQANDER